MAVTLIKEQLAGCLFKNLSKYRNLSEFHTLIIQDPSISAKDLIAKNAFEEMDSNNDGVVTMEEFLNACLGESDLASLLALKAVEMFVDN